MSRSYAVIGALLAVWLLLTESLAPGNLLLGFVLSLLFASLARPFVPEGIRLRRPRLLARLLAGALVEIVRSCINVSRIILFAHRGVNSQFIKVPLDLRDPAGLAVLSCIINSTPGTVWVEILPASHSLLLHVFDLHDEAWWVRTIKERYEAPLIAIFDGGSA